MSHGIQLNEQCKMTELRLSRKLPIILFPFCTRLFLNLNFISVLSVSNMGKCPFSPGYILATAWALTPTALAICTYNLEKV